jgi:hypothetical protein
MTAQDWLTGLDEDEEEPETATPHRHRWLVAVVAALVAVVVLAALAVVLFDQATTHRAASAATVPTPAATPAPDAAAGTAEVGPVLVKAALDYPGLIDSVVPTAPLVVGAQPVQGGVAPERVPNFDSCHADAASLQYLPVQIRMPENWLSARFTVQPTPSTPAGIGRLGFFFQAGEASIPCPAGAWSTSDSFQASNTGQEVITGYVVLDRAFTAATPQGRPDVFRTLGLRISNIRLSDRPAEVHPPTVGSFCPGTRSDLCASLG